jgi:hypothetical protein
MFFLLVKSRKSPVALASLKSPLLITLVLMRETEEFSRNLWSKTKHYNSPKVLLLLLSDFASVDISDGSFRFFGNGIEKSNS